jgi:hypothetical protein
MSKNNRKAGISVLGQLLKLIPKHTFNKLVEEHRTDRYIKKFNSWDHVVTMLYGVIQHTDSLRELCSGLSAHYGALIHLGMRSLPRRSTISDANKRRSPELFEKLFYTIRDTNRQFLSDSSLNRNEHWFKRLILIDSTTITLFKNILKACGRPDMNGRKKGGVKVHTGMHAQEDLPGFVRITSAATNDRTFLDAFKNIASGHILVFDKAYVNYDLFIHWSENSVTFVSRRSQNLVVEDVEYQPLTTEQETAGITADRVIKLGFVKSPKRMTARLVEYVDKETGKSFEFITNNMSLKPDEIALIYKQRWQIELLFKRLKQNLKITRFLGDNENCINIQIWAVLIADLLINIARNMKKANKMAYSNICGLIRLHLMQYVELQKLFHNPFDPQIFKPRIETQLKIF